MERWTRRVEYLDDVMPLMNRFLDACKAHGLPVVCCVVDSNVEDMEPNLHAAVQDLGLTPEASILRFISAVIKAAGSGEVFPVPVEAVREYIRAYPGELLEALVSMAGEVRIGEFSPVTQKVD